jgi:replicative DNA helicase
VTRNNPNDNYLPPHNAEAEKAIIGQLINGSGRISDVVEVLPEANRFYSPDTKLIYEAILNCYRAGSQIDPIVVVTELTSMGKLATIGGPFSVLQMSKDIALDHTIMRHAYAVLDCFKRRRAAELSGELIGKARDMTEDVDKAVHETELELLNILQEGDVSEVTDMKDLAVQFLEKFSNDRMNKSDITGVNTGYNYLNALLSGWQKTDLIILAARPSVGKTAFALNLALNAALYYGREAVGIFSLEMAKISMIEYEKIKKGTTSEIEAAHVVSTMDRIIKAPIYIDDSFSININQFRARAKRMVRKYGVKLIIIDYLQLMSGEKGKQNREQEIASITRGLKGAAKELDIPIIALSQMSREVEKRGATSKKPMLSDLRESGAIEQDADIVMFIYSDTDADTGETKNIVSVQKNRHGNLGDMDECKFFGEIQRWMNPSDAAAYMGQTNYKPHKFVDVDVQHSPKQISFTDEDETPF